MLARVTSAALLGVTAHRVQVEVHIGRGLPALTLVGLGDTAVMQARDRVRAAVANAGFDWPDRRITVSLSPADLPKQGSAFDLPIALGVLAAAAAIPAAPLAGRWVVGELGLGGDIRPVRGVLSVALAARAAGARALVVPRASLREAQLVAGLASLGARTLEQVAAWLRGTGQLERSEPPGLASDAGRSRSSERGGGPAAGPGRDSADLVDVRGQGQARRALEIAAAGAHNLLLVGPPGAGKTMLARRLPGLLPPLSAEEALEVTQVRSAAGLADPAAPLARERPFRAPHHTISTAGLVGGGARVPRPGEVAMAHHGVLFLDELCEFPRALLEALRQPLEDGHVTIARAGAVIRFPARFALVAASNPCPCGYRGDGERACRCAPDDLHRYQRRLSGPLLDRLDLAATLARVPAGALGTDAGCEPTAVVRSRVLAARAAQLRRGRLPNARLAVAELERCCRATPSARQRLAAAAETLGLSARAVHRSLRVARTIADLSSAERVDVDHMTEALAFRPAVTPEP